MAFILDGEQVFVGAKTCLPHLIAPCRKPPGNPSPGSAQGYNDVHGFYRSRVEQAFGVLWGFALVRNTWTGSEQRFFTQLKVLLNLYTFTMRRKYKYEPVGPWALIPEGVFAEGPSEIPPDHAETPQMGASQSDPAVDSSDEFDGIPETVLHSSNNTNLNTGILPPEATIVFGTRQFFFGGGLCFRLNPATLFAHALNIKRPLGLCL